MYGMGDQIMGLNDDISELRKENDDLKSELCRFHCKGKITTINFEEDEITLRLDIDGANGLNVEDVVIINL